MNKKSYFLLFLTVIACSCANKKTSTSYRIPAEWEPQDSLWMGFRTAERNISSDSITATDSLTLKLIKEITVLILNYHAGGMHCIYQPQPRLKKS